MTATDQGTSTIGVVRGLDTSDEAHDRLRPLCALPVMPDVFGETAMAGILSWPVGLDEFRAFRARAVEADDEDAGFVVVTYDRMESDDGGNLCIGVGTVPNEMMGFFILDRQVGVDTEDEVRYILDADRGYLLPEARGKGFSKAFVGLAGAVFAHDTALIARGLSTLPGGAVLTPMLTGYAESDNGARILNAIAETVGRMGVELGRAYPGVRVSELLNDCETYDPDVQPRP